MGKLEIKVREETVLRPGSTFRAREGCSVCSLIRVSPLAAASTYISYITIQNYIGIRNKQITAFNAACASCFFASSWIAYDGYTMKVDKWVNNAHVASTGVSAIFGGLQLGFLGNHPNRLHFMGLSLALSMYNAAAIIYYQRNKKE